MSRINALLALTLLALLAGASRQPAWAGEPCHHVRRANLPFLDNVSIRHDITSVTIYGDQAAQNNSVLQTSVQAGASKWNQACPKDQAKNSHIPTFSVDWKTNRPSVSSLDDQARRSIQVRYLDSAPPCTGSGAATTCSFAFWTGGFEVNLIDVYRKCPPGQNFPDFGCTGRANAGQLGNSNGSDRPCA